MKQTSRRIARSAKRDDAIVGAFLQLVARNPAGAMVVSPTQRATFAEIDALSRAVAAQIAAARLEHNGLIGLAAPNGPAFLAGFLAIRRSNQAALLLDPLAPREDSRRALTEMGTIAILECDEAWPSSAADFRLTRVGEPGAGSRPSNLGPPLPAPRSPIPATAPAQPLRDIAAVKLTSGSTGVPRGVAMRAEALIADEAALAQSMGFRSNDRLLAAIPMSFSYGFTTLALSAMVRGLTLVVPADRGPFAALEAARAARATIFPTGPSYIRALLKMEEPPAWPSEIRLVISAGAVLPVATAAQFRQTYGQPIHAFYGSSECGGICYDREGLAAERGTVGTPVDGVRVSLTQGLVTVESAAVGETYFPDPDARLAAGRFETTDLATWRDGELALLGRVDSVINIRGRKVDASEVEHVLAGLHGVEEVVVIGVPSADQREEVLRAVVACPSGGLGYEDIAAWCRARLADHKVPRSVVIVDAIPRTPRGKIDRFALVNLQKAEHRPGLVHE